MLRTYIDSEQCEWDLHLNYLAAAYRATHQESTGFTPNMLMLGKEVRLPAEIVVGTPENRTGEEIASYGQYVDTIRDRMQCAYDVARQHLKDAAARQKRTYDAKGCFHKYKVGDLVWYLHETRKKGECSKLYNPFEGPFVVVQRLNDLDLVIQFTAKGDQRVVHHNKLKPYEGHKILRWAKKAVSKAQINLANSNPKQ